MSPRGGRRRYPGGVKYDDNPLTCPFCGRVSQDAWGENCLRCIVDIVLYKKSVVYRRITDEDMSKMSKNKN